MCVSVCVHGYIYIYMCVCVCVFEGTLFTISREAQRRTIIFGVPFLTLTFIKHKVGQ